jgi:uncharacterized protein YabN with tetrapyrrole methylase and pyrophosphatase domain
MIRRHPPVFGTAQVQGARAQSRAWEAVKAMERASRAGAEGDAGVLDDVPLALPALIRAAKLQRRAARVGFDWPESVQVVDKMQEEIAELRAELGQGASVDRLIERQMDCGFGGLMSFLVKGDAKAALALAGRLRLIARATSLGGTESLIEHRFTIEGAGTGVPPNLLRVSVRIEDKDDLIAGLAQALNDKG